MRHYGSTRGLDRWKDFSFCVTVGEDWPNVVTNKLEAEELGIDAFTRSKWVVAAELDQVHGRLRDPRRATPCIHIHIGSVLPYGWVGNRKPKIHGKGVPQAKSDRDLIQQLLDAMGGERGTLALAARKLGIPRASLSNYRRGRAMPPVIRMKIEAAIMEAA